MHQWSYQMKSLSTAAKSKLYFVVVWIISNNVSTSFLFQLNRNSHRSITSKHGFKCQFWSCYKLLNQPMWTYFKWQCPVVLQQNEMHCSAAALQFWLKQGIHFISGFNSGHFYHEIPRPWPLCTFLYFSIIHALYDPMHMFCLSSPRLTNEDTNFVAFIILFNYFIFTNDYIFS